MGNLKESKKEFLPADGVILKKTTVTFEDGETVFDVLKRVCKENNIQMESSYTPGYDNYYLWIMAGKDRGFYMTTDEDHKWLNA